MATQQISAESHSMPVDEERPARLLRGHESNFFRGCFYGVPISLALWFLIYEAVRWCL